MELEVKIQEIDSDSISGETKLTKHRFKGSLGRLDIPL